MQGDAQNISDFLFDGNMQLDCLAEGEARLCRNALCFLDAGWYSQYWPAFLMDVLLNP